MPSRFLVRDFRPGGTYHIFNRGVDQRRIFVDEEDYNLFIYYLYIYLTPLDKVLRRYHDLPVRLFKKNVAKDLDMLAYCLMPNHVHFLIKQKKDTMIPQLMKQLTNAYTEYFNKKYKRSGSLFEGPYKAVPVTSNELLAHLSRYIHLNPVVANLSRTPSYQWSSYPAYTDDVAPSFCNPKPILSLFASVYAYKKFVLDQKDYAKKLHEIKRLTIE